MDDKNPIDKETWWGCRRCPKWVRKDTWSAHGAAHAMVEAAIRLKLATDRAMKNDYATLSCGVCHSPHGTNGEALMAHIQGRHLTVFYRNKP